MKLPTLKCSAIYVANRGGTRVFRSADELPPKVRTALVKSTSSVHSATILIADRNGYQELTRGRQLLGVKLPVSEQAPAHGLPLKFLRNWRSFWVDLSLIAGFSLLAWLLQIME